MKTFKATDENGEINYRSPFWKHLREYPELSSKLGYRCSDVDGVWYNPNTGKYILIENKCRKAFPEQWQTLIYTKLTRALETDPKFRGTWMLRHIGESLRDGGTYLHKLVGMEWKPYLKDGVVWRMDEDEGRKFLKEIIG